MSSEAETLKKIEQYQELAKTDKNVDVAALTLNELQQANKTAAASGKRRWLAYFISIGFPPFGLIYAVYYFFRNRPSDRRAALWCVVLTVVSVLLTLLLSGLVLSNFAATAGMDLSNLKSSDVNKILEDYQSLLK